MSRALLPFLLAASLLANAWLVVRIARTPEPAASAPAGARPAAAAADRPASAAAVMTRAPQPAPRTEAELRSLRAQLEALGLAPTVVRAVIAMLLNQSFQQRFAALQQQPGPDEYWRNPGGQPPDIGSAAWRDLSREQRRLFRELVGGELELDENAQRRQFGGLPEGKVAALKRILADYSELEEQSFAEGDGAGGPAHRARLALLAREKRADIERLLSPEELLNYDLRNSPAAHQLRSRIGQFEVTEAEFRALFPSFQAAFNSSASDSPGLRGAVESRTAREQREQQLKEQLRQVLGEERFRAWQEANDPALQQTRALAARLNLPPQVAQEIIAVQREFSPQLTAIDRDRDLTPNQRDARASALGLEARERLIRLLGPEGFETYKRQGGGWLGAALNRAPPAPTPAP